MDQSARVSQRSDRQQGDGYSDDGFEPVLSTSSLRQDGNGPLPATQDTKGDGYSDDGFDTVQSDASLNHQESDLTTSKAHAAAARSSGNRSMSGSNSQKQETRTDGPTQHPSAGPSASHPASAQGGRGKKRLPPVPGSSRGRSRATPTSTNSSAGQPLPRPPSPSDRAQSKTRSPSPPRRPGTSRLATANPESTRPTTASTSDTPGGLRRLMSIESFPTIQPVANRLLAERWEKKRFGLHQKALREVQATVDNSCPGSFGEWRTANPKKVQIVKDRQSLIDHQNALLLSKFEQVAEATHREYAVNPQTTQLRDTLSDRVHTRRLKQLNTIHAQNGTLLRRIDSKSSKYRVSSWTMERLQTLYYLINVSDHKSKYVQEMLRLSDSLVAAGQPLPPNIKAALEPLRAAKSHTEPNAAGQHLPTLPNNRSSTRPDGSSEPRTKSAKLQPLQSDRAEPSGHGIPDAQYDSQTVDV